MSFELHAIKSLEANRALRKGSGTFFSRESKSSTPLAKPRAVRALDKEGKPYRLATEFDQSNTYLPLAIVLFSILAGIVATSLWL